LDVPGWKKTRPGPVAFRESRQGKSEEHTADDEHQATELVEDGVDGLPPEMITQLRMGVGQVVQPVAVDERCGM
jgi:hypothetical protein